MLLTHEILEEKKVSGKSIMTPSGWRKVKTAYKTVKLPTWKICTATKTLIASGHHLIHTPGKCRELRDICVGDVICTDAGEELVTHVSPTGRKEHLYDITIDTKDGLFYSNGIVSHNSTAMAGRQLINSNIMPDYASLYVVPYHDHQKTYARKLEQMEKYFRNSSGKQNMYNKKFKTGSTIDIIYCLTSAVKSRGKTVSDLLIDECQSMDPDIIPELTFVQTDAETPVTIFAGTALTVDTLLEQKWQDSSMGCWMVKSPNGKDWIDCYDTETLFKICSNPNGPICPITDRPLDVTRGKYVHRNMHALERGRIGLHVPQVIVTDIANNPVKWQNLYSKVKSQDPKKVMQECFGIATAEGSREITESDLHRIACITETESVLKHRCRTGYYKLVVSGVDWGGSDYNQAMKTKTSYTVHTILGVDPVDNVHILYFRRYAGMDFRDIIERIVYDHHDWNATLTASDAGVGAAYNVLLREKVDATKHFIMAYSGPNVAPIAIPKHQHLHNQLTVNKQEIVSTVFNAIKHRDSPLLARTWDFSGDYLSDFLAMVRIIKEDANGNTVLRYHRAATKADDALQAVCFAYVLIKFYRGESIIEDPTLAANMRDAIYDAGPIRSLYNEEADIPESLWIS